MKSDQLSTTSIGTAATRATNYAASKAKSPGGRASLKTKFMSMSIPFAAILMGLSAGLLLC
jgi:hypothetical protein